MKIFKVNECEWWAGQDLESVLTAYRNDIGEDADSPHEISDLEAQRLKFVEGDDPTPPENWTFAQQLDHMIAAGNEFPCFFATTEW